MWASNWTLHVLQQLSKRAKQWHFQRPLLTMSWVLMNSAQIKIALEGVVMHGDSRGGDNVFSFLTAKDGIGALQVMFRFSITEQCW
jgi:hypothetical protein